MSCEYCKSDHYLVNESWSAGELHFSLLRWDKKCDWIMEPGWYVHTYCSASAATTLTLETDMPVDYCPKCGRKLGGDDDD